VKRVKFFVLLILFCTLLSNVANCMTDDEVIKLVEEEHLMNGTDNGFEATKTLTRAEVATVLVRLKGQELILDDNKSFIDVPNNYWAKKYINTAFHHGIVKGVTSNEFMPNKEITLGEATTMLVRAIGDYEEVEKKLNWPQNYIDFANSFSLLEGINANGNDVIRRIDMARMLANLNTSKDWNDKLTPYNEDKEKDYVDTKNNDGVIKSVGAAGVLISVSYTDSDYLDMEIAFPNTIKTLKVHKLDVEPNMLIPGTYLDFWLSGDRMWDLKAFSFEDADYGNAKIMHIGDGVVKLKNKNEMEPEFVDSNNIIFLKCDSTTWNGVNREFENLKIGYIDEVSCDSDYANIAEVDDIYYHSIVVDGVKKLVAIIYTKD